MTPIWMCFLSHPCYDLVHQVPNEPIDTGSQTLVDASKSAFLDGWIDPKPTTLQYNSSIQLGHTGYYFLQSCFLL